MAAIRRWELPEEERFRVPYRAWIGAGRAELLEPESRQDVALNVLLVLSILLATASVGYAVVVPKENEQFSELYLLTEGDDGLVAADYPTEFVRGDPRSVVVGIGNHEHETVEYTVVAELQRVEIDGEPTGTPADAVVNDTTGDVDLSISVRESREVGTFEATLEHNETWIRPHTVTPRMTGDRLRLTYLLYTGSPPTTPTAENAYRSVWVWVNVSEPAVSPLVPVALAPGTPAPAESLRPRWPS